MFMHQVKIKVKPGAKQDKIESVADDGSLVVRLKAPAVDNKANAALIVFLADFFHIPRRDIEIRVGLKSRNKVIRLNGIDPQLFQQALKTIK